MNFFLGAQHGVFWVGAKKFMLIKVYVPFFLPLNIAPSTAGTSRKKFRKNSGKTPETLSELFQEFPSRVRLGPPRPYTSRHLKPSEHFQNCLPPQYGWGRLFFSEVVPERASQSWSWNSQQ